MHIQIKFASILRKLAGCDAIVIEVDATGTVAAAQIVIEVACKVPQPLAQALMDESQQLPRTSVLLFVDNAMIPHDRTIQLTQNSDVVITTLISGG
jgi:hypothetical protein